MEDNDEKPQGVDSTALNRAALADYARIARDMAQAHQERLEQERLEQEERRPEDMARARMHELLTRRVNEGFINPQPSALAELSGLREMMEREAAREEALVQQQLRAMNQAMNARAVFGHPGVRGSTAAQEEARYFQPASPPVLTPWGEAHQTVSVRELPLAPDEWFRREILRRVDAPFDGNGKSFLDWAFQTFDEYTRRKKEG